MASIPQQYPPNASADTAAPAQPQDQDATGTTSADDFPLIVSNTPSPTEMPLAELQDLRPTLRREDTDLKKCWICFADESEDTPETSQWRSPCPCALVAHEECLLDWIADMESPESKKRTIGPMKILCPQCKSEIRLARPWDPLVEIVRSAERISASVSTPGAALLGLGSFIHLFNFHGVYSVYAVFGPEDAWEILHPYLNPRRYHEPFNLQIALQDFREHWRLHFGLPMITPMLFLSRTTLADSILPVLPIIFFAAQGDPDQPVALPKWPPSAAMTLAVLPYIRGLYNTWYEHTWGAHMRRWQKEIQPRAGRNDDTNQNNANNAGANNADGAGGDEGDDDDDDGADGNVFEIRIDGNLWDDWGDNAQAAGDAAAAAPRPAAPPLHAPPEDNNDDAAAPAPQIPRQPPAPPPAQVVQAQPAERRLSYTTNGLATHLLGALLFPSIASLAGDLLLHILPASWTACALPPRGAGMGFSLFGFGQGAAGTSPGTIVPAWCAGLLGKKWGRSIVGGCLAVVVKDAVMLYVRWKMAKGHRERRVLDFRGSRGRRRVQG